MPAIDELGASAATRLRDEVRAHIDVEARLASIHASGAMIAPVRRRVPPRVWAAAASVVIIAVGAVGLSTLRSGGGAVSPSPTPVDSTPSASSTTTPVETLPSVSLDPIAVSYSSPPPTFQPRVFATVSLDAQVGITETGAVVATNGSVYTVDWDGTSSEVTSIGWDLIYPVVFEGVVYGLAQPSSGQEPVMVSAALLPNPAGVLSATPVGGAAYIELPVAPFGLGRDGIVDRVRDVGATVAPYAAYGGSPHVFEAAASATMDDSWMVTSSGGQRWQLSRESDPAAATGPPAAPERAGPLPGADGTVVLLSSIGAPVDADADFSTYEQPVIAQLEADGSGRWWSLPEGWTLAASDVFGTVLQRTTSNGIELARFPDDDPTTPTTPTAPDASITEVDVQPRKFPLGVTGCDPQQEQYCSVDSLADGRLLVYRASTDSLITIDSDGRQQERPLRPSLSGYMIAVGPDDVVYLATGNGETAGDIVAYRLDPSFATEIRRVSGVVDPSGDTDLVATRTGLVAVGCCGGSAVRPDPSAEPLMTWVDGSGATVTEELPRIRVEDAEGGVVFVRVNPDGSTTRWPSNGSFPAAIRGMPGVAPLADGGAIVTYQDMLSGAGITYLRLKPSGAIERTISPDVFGFPTRSGRLIGASADGPVQLVLATFTDATDAYSGDLPTGTSADAVIDALLSQLSDRNDCDSYSAALLNRSGTDPVVATVGWRTGCDDSGGGQNLTFSIGSSPDGTWSVTAATTATLCLRGLSDGLCV